MSPLAFSDRIFCLPIIHGSGDCAIEVRRLMLSQAFDCVAVPLPPSFQVDVEEAITKLPRLSVVCNSSGSHRPVERKPVLHP
jgi:hypothetical protein